LSEITRLRGTGPVRFETGAVSAAPIEGRPEDLRRAVRNLLEYAERHARSTVRVGLWTGDDGHTTLVVEDDGSEQLPAETDLVFEPFTRLPEPEPPPSAARETGSGLALAVVRDIAVAHGGRVALEAAGPGSRFILELPPSPVA
jgi:signal transduction histidine kinase